MQDQIFQVIDKLKRSSSSFAAADSGKVMANRNDKAAASTDISCTCHKVTDIGNFILNNGRLK